MNHVLGSTILLVLLLAPRSSIAQVLWGKTEYGMTIEQVTAVLPDAKPPQNPRRLDAGDEEKLRIENIDLVKRKFSASFFFADGKLTQVYLTIQDGLNRREVFAAFDALTEALRAKYGREISHSKKENVTKHGVAAWMSGRTNINLAAISVTDADGILNVVYQVQIARDSDKL